jgi:hypothetical protein
VKLGIGLSILILLAALGYVLLSGGGDSDAATAASSDEALQQVSWPENLPTINSDSRSDGVANPIYTEAFRFAKQNERGLQKATPEPALTERAAELLIDAMDASVVEAGLLDDRVPLTIGGGNEAQSHLRRLSHAVLVASDQWKKDQPMEAERAAAAVVVMGERLITQSQRLALRRAGLAMMQQALPRYQMLLKQREADTASATIRIDALGRVLETWTPKLQTMYSPEVNVADLIRIAEKDQDRSWRIAATLWLGYAKFRPDGQANLASLEAAIDRAKQHDDPQIAEAGRAAEAFTRDDFHRL